MSAELFIVPVNFRTACAFVNMWHRHLPPAKGHVFSIGAADSDGVLVGVATVGMPVARALSDGRTLEVNRCATDGTRNATSFLYARAWKVARELGWSRLITYTQQGESGASLRGAGWRVLAVRPAHGGWNRPSRPRIEHAESIPRTLWEAAS